MQSFKLRFQLALVSLLLFGIEIPGLTAGQIREDMEERLYSDEIQQVHVEALDKYLKNTEKMDHVKVNKNLLLPDLSVLNQLFDREKKKLGSASLCHACRVGFALFLTQARGAGTTFEELKRTTIRACQLFRLSSPEVCKGMIQLFAPVLRYIGRERRDLTADRFCGLTLQAYGCVSMNREQFEWNIDPEDPGTELKGYVEMNPDLPIQMKTLKILHLTDIHLDLLYRVGSNAACGDELCCRGGTALKSEHAAGAYGDLRKCDLPYHTLEATLDHISRVHEDVALVYITGDFVPHDGWTTSRKKNIKTLRNVSSLILEKFPSTTRIVPVIGNHESHPLNMFAPSWAPAEFTSKWLYEAAGEAWKEWIPEETTETFLQNGYYHTLIVPGFRVVVLNTNFCYGFNFWQSFEFRDPGNQLKWLAHVLGKSRALGEQVHILGHVPPGQNECSAVWSKNFYEIIYRYRDIVKSQFYGHTHQDEFQLYYHKEKKEEPINSIFIGPSLSPFINLNPAYKIYSVDGARGPEHSTWNVLDFETWSLSLKTANRLRSLQPEWSRLYKATEAFEIPNTLPTSLHELAQRLNKNQTWLNYYYKLSTRASSEDCDKACMGRVLCSITKSNYEAQAECIESNMKPKKLNPPQSLIDKIRTSIFAPLSKATTSIFGVFGL